MSIPEYIGAIRMNFDETDVVSMSLPLLHLFHGIVIIHS